jgi:hypothetical protein
VIETLAWPSWSAIWRAVWPAFAEQGDFLGGEGAGWVIGWGFDGVDFADGVDGDGAVADGEFHGAGDDGAAGLGGGCSCGGFDFGEDGVEAWGDGFTDAEFAEGGADVVLEGTAVGVQGCRGAFVVGDQAFEPLLPQIEEVVHLVHRGELAGLVGLGPVLELLKQRTLGRRLVLAEGSHRADMTVVVAEPRLGSVADRLAVLIGPLDRGGDPSPGSDGQWVPPTSVVGGSSTPGRAGNPRRSQRCEAM